MRISAIAFACGSVVSAAAVGEPIVKTEPAMGALKEGQVVMVDDGTCPVGQIKRVVGGNHTKVGGYKKIERVRSCVAR